MDNPTVGAVMERAAIQQCECWGDDDDHKDTVTIDWSDGTSSEIPVRCPGNDVDPYMDLPEVATTGIFWTKSPPVRGYICNLRTLADGVWILDAGETDEQPEVLAIRGTGEEALEVWLSEGESLAPGTRRCLAARITHSLDGVPTDQEGSHPQYLYAGDVADTEPTLSAYVDPASLGSLGDALASEFAWVTSPDASAEAWRSRLEWWQAQGDWHATSE